MKTLKGVTLVSVCISVLYIVLAAILPLSGVTFRAWADALGQTILWLVTPLLLVSLLLVLLWKSRYLTETPKAVITLLAVLACMIGAFFVCLLIAFGREDETMLTKNLIVIEQPYPVDDSHCTYYRPAGLFFKMPTRITNADRADYLCEKYDLEFIVDERNGRIYEPMHPEITVTVDQLGLSLTDDYMEELTCRYLKEGYEALGLKQEYVLHEKGTGQSDSSFCLVGKNLGDLPALSKNIFLLADYCIKENGGDSEDNIYRRHSGSIPYLFGQEREAICQFRYTFQYGQLDPDAIKEEVLGHYQDELAAQKRLREKEASLQSQESGNASESDGEAADFTEVEETPEPDYREKPAKMIYDAFLAQEGFSSYEVCFNAKGNLYIDLGSRLSEEDGQTYNYRLVYDRPSKNGLCELFVLYRSVPGSDDEAIVDMYAAEPDTGEVARSGKKAWSDVGTKVYRDLTGE